jgi:hypothetical protein
VSPAWIQRRFGFAFGVAGFSRVKTAREFDLAGLKITCVLPAMSKNVTGQSAGRTLWAAKAGATTVAKVRTGNFIWIYWGIELKSRKLI